MSTGIGYGKIILFGEHFVVHGLPAIALGLSNKAVVEIKKSKEVRYTTTAVGTIPELTTSAITLLMKAMKIKDNFHVHLSGDLPTVGGLGSSAAFCVALARAFDKEYKMNLNDDEINKYAYEGEKAFHGNPSGVDNTVATYGGAIKFTKGKDFEKIRIGCPMHFVVGMSGISSPTVKMVGQVKLFKENEPEEFSDLCDEALDILKKGEEAVAGGNLKLIGELMNENQELLKAIGVSIEKNEQIIKIALENGALGAKVTGGGGGGCCLILAREEKHAREIMDKLNKNKFGSFTTVVQSTS